MRKTYIAVVVILFLSCLVAGAGWLTTKWDLETARIINQQLTVENEQYASDLKGANEQVILLNQQIQQTDATIENLKRKLTEAESYSSYWWQRAHPREFQSLDELKSWLAEDNTNAIHLISGEYAWEGTWVDPDYDCDDYATTLMRNALEDGYLVSTQISVFTQHMLNSTIIGNRIYFIEPQTDEVWLSGYRD